MPATIGALVAAIGGLTVWALLRRSVMLVQLHPDYPPVQFNGAVCIVLLGTSLFFAMVGRSLQWRIAAFIAASGSCALAAVVFAQHLFGLDLGVDTLFYQPSMSTSNPAPGRFAPNVALGLLMIGVALILLARRRALFASAALGAVAFTLGASVLVGYLAGTPELFDWPDQNPMAVTTAVCLALLGCGVVIAASSRFHAGLGRVWWGPLLTAVAITAAGLVLWNALRVEHTRRVQTALRAESAAVRSELVGALRLPIDRLRLFAARVELPVVALPSEDVLGLSNVQWYAGGPARPALPAEADGERSQQALLALALAYAQERRTSAVVGPFVGPGDQAQIRVVTPVIRNETVEGFLSGAISVSALSELARTARAERPVDLEILCGMESVFRSTGELDSSAWRETVDLRLPGPLPWDLVVVPVVGFSAAEGAELPEVVLGVMLATALLLALSTQIGGSQASRAERLTEAVRERSRELRATLRSLQRSNTAKDHFIGMLGHELRNPLGAIVAATELLRRGEREADAIDVIEKESEHLSRVLDDLLDVARIERGQLLIERKPVDLAALVRDVVAPHQWLAETGDRVLSIEVPPDEVRLEADATRVRQIVGNLLANAIRFSPPGGKIEVLVAADPDRRLATLRIRNEGVGIDAEDMPHIFEPFVQTRTDPMDDRAGLGLGLPIVRGLVEAHGGQVYGRSEGRGRGAEFCVELPLADSASGDVTRTGGRYEAVDDLRSGPSALDLPVLRDDGASGDKPPARDPEARQRPSVVPERTTASSVVLLIEDHVNAAEMLRSLISRFGYDVEVAHTGSEALALAAECAPDLVLCDLGLPGISGFEVAERLRLDPAFADIPIIAISGYGREQDLARARQAGFDHHLIKPVGPAKLRALLDRHLRPPS